MANLIVETKYGKVEGFEKEDLNLWLGVPFAKPPVGKLRFKRAQEPEKWQGVKECKEMPKRPIQFSAPDNLNESEDCLYLNVWTPKNAKKAPVFVWIYGGGCHYGSNSDPSYDGENMAKDGVVYVAITYRLGVFGFYDFSMYDESCDSNCAISDMAASLKFVKENIATFGGDPDNITIAGESAGGSAVAAMMASPASKGLFNKAILQSAAVNATGSKKVLQFHTDLLLERMGKKPEDIKKEFRTIDAFEFKRPCGDVLKNYMSQYPYLWMAGPEIGDDLLPEWSWEAIEKGSAEGVDIILGTTHDEGSNFIKPLDPSVPTWPNKWEDVQKMLKLNGREDLFSKFKEYYGQFSDDFITFKELCTDRGFIIDSMKIADNQTKFGKVYVYRFDFVPVALKMSGLGAMHSSEISFALNTLDKGYFSQVLKGTPEEDVNCLRDQINGAWLAFSKTGNPNHDGYEWPEYTIDTKITHVFDKIPHDEANYKAEARALWGELGDIYSEEKFRYGS